MKNDGLKKNKVSSRRSVQHQTPGFQQDNIQLKHSLSSNDKQLAKNFLAKLELGDLCFPDIIEYGFALFGETKAGKTTLAHHLVKNILTVVSTSDRPAYALDTKTKPRRLAEAVIGMKNESETVIPNSCQLQFKIDNKQAYLLDCPGYTDSKGPFLVVANAYFHYRIFSKVRNLKFIITFDANSLSDTYQKPARTLINFLKSFKNISQIKKNIIDATVFYFTKTNEQKEISIDSNLKCMKQRAQSMLKSNRGYSETVVQLINSVIEHKKYFFFRQAGHPSGRIIPKQDEIKTIHSKTKFWARKQSDRKDQVDMSHIRFAVGKELQSINDNEEDEKKFDILCSQSAQRFSEVLGSIKSNEHNLKTILNAILNNCISGALNFRQIITKDIQKFVEMFYSFGGLDQQSGKMKEFYQERRSKMKKRLVTKANKAKNYKVQWIQELQIARQLIEFVQANSFIVDQGYPRDIQFFIKISQSILSIISKLHSIPYFPTSSDDEKNYLSLVENFCYTIYRLLEEAKIFRIIFAYDHNKQESGLDFKYSDKTVMIYDIVSSLCHESFQICQKQDPKVFKNAKLNYIIGSMQVKSNQPLSYYNEIEQYCKDLKDTTDSAQYNRKVNQINQFRRDSNIANPTLYTKIATLINDVRISMNSIRLTRSLLDEQKYIQYMNELADELLKPILQEKSTKLIANLELTRKHLINAIKVYKKVGNVYKTIQAYRALKTFYNQKDSANELKIIVCQFAEYAVTHGRRELALQNFQHAYYLIDLIHKKSLLKDYETKRAEKERLAQRIGLIGLDKRYDLAEDYYDKMINKQFSELIEEKQLEQIQKILEFLK